MALTFTVGGARGTFEDRFADEVAEVLDHAFGAEGEWEGSPTLNYGELADTGWSELQRRAIDELGAATGQMVAFTEGREASNPFYPTPVPVDAYLTLIVDSVDVGT